MSVVGFGKLIDMGRREENEQVGLGQIASHSRIYVLLWTKIWAFDIECDLSMV